MDEEEQQFIKGFNAGYQLSKHEPQLINKLLKEPNPNNEYFEGLRLGKKEHEREKIKQALKDHQNKKSNDKEFER